MNEPNCLQLHCRWDQDSKQPRGSVHTHKIEAIIWRLGAVLKGISAVDTEGQERMCHQSSAVLCRIFMVIQMWSGIHSLSYVPLLWLIWCVSICRHTNTYSDMEEHSRTQILAWSEEQTHLGIHTHSQRVLSINGPQTRLSLGQTYRPAWFIMFDSYASLKYCISPDGCVSFSPY